MDYELIISERADELTERLTSYLLNNLKNPGAAAHFLNELDSVYLTFLIYAQPKDSEEGRKTKR